MDYQFRDARHGDEPGIQRVVDTVLREFGMHLDLHRDDADLLDVVKSYQARRGVFRVVVADERIVGCGGLYQLSDSVAELRKMYLLAPARGRGLGLALLRHLVSAAMDFGYERIVLKSKADLRDAVAMYRRFGFVDDAMKPATPRCDLSLKFDLVGRDASMEAD